MHTKISIQGNIIEVTTMLRKSDSCPIQRISADEYIRLDDGEVLPFKHADNRAELSQSLYRTFRKIRAIINSNFTGAENELFITLTYAENMQDAERLYSDFKAFWKRFKRRYGYADYFSVAEPQARGAWHLHLLVKFLEEYAPWIDNSELRELWRHGFVNIQKVDNIDNIGAYLSAYLADAEVPLDSKEGEIKTFSDGTKKGFVKGGRLHLYPAGMNIYRCSRGIKPPVEFWATPEQEEALTDGIALTYANRIEFTKDDGFKQIVEKRFYNRKRSNEIHE